MKKSFTALIALCGSIMLSFPAPEKNAMNALAEQYVHLVLALGQHDPDYVDAFYGPAEWKTQAEKEKKSLDAIGRVAAELTAALNQDQPSPQSSPKGRGDREAAASKTSDDEMLKLRR